MGLWLVPYARGRPPIQQSEGKKVSNDMITLTSTLPRDGTSTARTPRQEKTQRENITSVLPCVPSFHFFLNDPLLVCSRSHSFPL